MTDVTNHEPTIEEMLAWLDLHAYRYNAKEDTRPAAIRAILEQHRDHSGHDPRLCEVKWREREAIRAFVERVEKRLPDYNTGKGADSWLKAYRLAVMDELAEMEKQ